MSKQAQTRQFIAKTKRLVIKIGSGVLASDDGLDLKAVRNIARDVTALTERGIKVVIVSSGAIASGIKKAGLTKKLYTVQEKQAFAAVGQPSLMLAYENALQRFGAKTAQVLLTSDDLSNRRRHLNARNTLTTLLDWGFIPIVNENDTVVVEEIKFGDNDKLSSLICALVEAELLINLTDIDGLYDSDPRTNPDAAFIPLVTSVTKKIEAFAGTIPGALGTGGMFSKVQAARRVGRHGVPAIIAGGKKKGVIGRIMQGEEVGTLFLPKGKPMGQKKHWIAYTSTIKGRVIVDDGARDALLNRGKSLLPSGIVEVRQHFNIGDSIEVVTRRGRVMAVGLTNYSSEELKKIMGRHTKEVESILGYKNSDEVLHRDNMVVGRDLRQ